jgi:hypothetical protein
MNNWTVEQITFRCERLSVRLEKLAQNFLQMASLSLDEFNGEAVLEIIRESKVFLELTAIDLDVDNASTLHTLFKIDEQLLDEYKFATITFEHDFYASDLDYDIWAITRKRSREVFQRRGYVLMFPDVRLPSNTSYRGKQCGSFEDWYVHPDLVRSDLIDKYKTEDSLFFKDIRFE